MIFASNSVISPCYHKGNEKNHNFTLKCFTIGNTVSGFNAEEFAKWMREAYGQSAFKSYRDLAKAASSNPATISRLMNAAAHSTTDKPSRPKADLIEKLAALFRCDSSIPLRIAGYATPSDDELVADGLFSGYYTLPPDRQKLARKQIAAIIRSLTDEDFDEQD